LLIEQLGGACSSSSNSVTATSWWITSLVLFVVKFSPAAGVRGVTDGGGRLHVTPDFP
jgi:hypothetical protein